MVLLMETDIIPASQNESFKSLYPVVLIPENLSNVNKEHDFYR